MSKYLRFAKVLLFFGSMAIFGLVVSPATAQQFRMPNNKVAPPIFVFPPAPNNPMLNNASLYTFPNVTVGQPGQLPFAFVAVAHQDCRLYHNGATLMPFPRLVAGLCTDMMPANIQPTGGWIPTYQSVLFPLGGGAGGGAGGAAGAAGAAGAQGAGGGPIMQGFGAVRYPVMPSYSPAADLYYSQLVSAYQMQQGYQDNGYRLPGGTVPTGFFGSNSSLRSPLLTADNGFGGLGTFDTTGFGNFPGDDRSKDGRKDE